MNLRDTIGHEIDAIPAMNAAPAATDSIIQVCKAILERLGATPADPDDSALTVLGQRDDAAGDDPDSGTLSVVQIIKAALRAWKCVVPNIDVSLAAIDNTLTVDPSAGVPDAANTIMDLTITVGTMYKIEDLILKVSGYGTGASMTIKLWELLNGNARASYVVTKTVVIPTDYAMAEYLHLVDLFGKPSIIGDGIAITAQTDVGNTGALTCTYTYSTSRVS